ncbi:hypothetical protein HKBW3S42_02307 [Candidatus Hakubella thermalkaliphila]|uniref:Uncharacterized protein n=1 Tax=Candidatus Hakubella thermalkaliphila TaxID=2754717 RepID=A0A6V8PNZ1_9ACTN|nr:hypothetical protein HKBW3S42_02307 [Candidatus Hakubella thermalkaliphila]
MEQRYSKKLILRMEKNMVVAIEDYRRAQEVIPTVSDAIRQLITVGLNTAKKPAREKKNTARKGRQRGDV